MRVLLEDPHFSDQMLRSSQVLERPRFRELPRGILNGDLQGWVKLVVDRSSLRLLGVHIIGESACELIHYGSALLHSGITMSDVAHSVFAAATFHGLYEAAAEEALARVSAIPDDPEFHSLSEADQAGIRHPAGA